MPTYRANAIVLKENDCLKDDRLFNIYTKEKGKIQIRITGGKKIKNKLAAHVQPFFEIDMLIAKGRSCDRVAGARSAVNFSGIRNDLCKTAAACCLQEVVDKLCKIQVPDDRIYSLLFNYLKLIEDSRLKSWELEKLISFFSLKILGFLGYRPWFEICVYCQKKVFGDKVYLLPAKGGIGCSRCVKDNDKHVTVNKKTAEILGLAYLENTDNLLRLKIEKNQSEEISSVAKKFLEYQLEKPLLSFEFFRTCL